MHMASTRLTNNDTIRLPFERGEYPNGAPRGDTSLATRIDLPGILYWLEEALASAEGARGQWWTEWAVGELREARAALGHRDAPPEAPDALLADIDVTRAGLFRQGLRLCREEAELLARARMALMLTEIEIRRRGSVGGHIRRRIERLIEALRQHQTEETDLILESV